jgi:hypothetical protein
MTIDARSLPSEITEVHYFPGRFDLQHFGAELSEAYGDGEHMWLFHTGYDIKNGNQYSLSAGHEQAELTTTNNEGGELRYSFNPDVAGRFLASLTITALGVGDAFVPQDILTRDGAWSKPATLRALLRLIGERNGEFVSRRVSLLTIDDDERGVLVTETQRETPSSSSVELKYRVASMIGYEMLTDATSNQHETMQSGVNDMHRTAYRQPGQFLPEELAISTLFDGNEDEKKMFLPHTDPIEYARINAQVMNIISRRLAEPKYADLETPESLEAMGRAEVMPSRKKQMMHPLDEDK